MVVAIDGKFLTTEETAAILGVTVGRVRQFVQDDRLPAKRVGTMLLFEEKQVKQFAKQPRVNGRPKGV